MTASSTEAQILLVDDESHVTDALSRHFPKHTYRVHKANSAAEAYGILDCFTIDVVVSDERMPGESGAEFLGNVRRRFPKTIRIILSGQASLEAAIRAINEGEVYRFFLKPCNPTDLIFTIQRALEQQRLAEQSRSLLLEFRRQAALLEAHDGFSELLDVQRDGSGAVLIDDGDASDSVDGLLKEIEEAMARGKLRVARRTCNLTGLRQIISCQASDAPPPQRPQFRATDLVSRRCCQLPRLRS
jgi:response regulator RpfG family c-di-GMP phosphodiesterase